MNPSALKHQLILLLATGFHSGRMPVAPGTFGSLAGLALCYLLSVMPALKSIPVLIIFICLSMWIAGEAETLLGAKDPGSIVIDEVAGMAVTLTGLPFTPANALAGFVLFRFFDILKPFPIRQLEKRIPGGIGVVLDDLLAGVYALLVLRMGKALWM
ncbi:MAG: phosphatidylglycerophosphatase A [Thermodesulfobacteriota bacterium]